MKRDIIDYAKRGIQLPLDNTGLKPSELNELAQIALKGDLAEALIYAFHAGAYIGFRKGSKHDTSI